MAKKVVINLGRFGTEPKIIRTVVIPDKPKKELQPASKKPEKKGTSGN